MASPTVADSAQPSALNETLLSAISRANIQRQSATRPSVRMTRRRNSHFAGDCPRPVVRRNQRIPPRINTPVESAVTPTTLSPENAPLGEYRMRAGANETATGTVSRMYPARRRLRLASATVRGCFGTAMPPAYRRSSSR